MEYTQYICTRCVVLFFEGRANTFTHTRIHLFLLPRHNYIGGIIRILLSLIWRANALRILSKCKFMLLCVGEGPWVRYSGVRCLSLCYVAFTLTRACVGVDVAGTSCDDVYDPSEVDTRIEGEFHSVHHVCCSCTSLWERGAWWDRVAWILAIKKQFVGCH